VGDLVELLEAERDVRRLGHAVMLGLAALP
jgi:hypothetical protein